MYSNSTIGIGLSMFLRDQFSAPAARISSSADALTNRMSALTSKLQMERNVGAGMAFAGGMALRGMGRVINESAEFSFMMESVRAVAELTQEQTSELTSKVKQLGQDTLFMSRDVASAAKYMGMAGFSFKEIMGSMEAAVMVAGATHSELGGKGGTADIMTNIMRSFMIDPAMSGNAMRVADIMTTATIKAQLDMVDLAEALKYTSSTAMDLGVSLEDTVAMIMTLSNAGIRGTMAGTAIENELRYMSRSLTEFGTPKQIESLKQLGLTFHDLQDGSGNLLPITEIFKKLGDSIKTNFGGEQRALVQNLLQNVFGVRGKRAASLLVRDYDTFMNFVETLKSGSMGSSVSVMNQMMNNIWGTLERIRSAAENVRISFTEAIAPFIKVIGTALEGILSFVNMVMEVPYLGNIIAGMLGGFVTWVTVLGTGKLLVSGITLLMGSFGTTSSSVLLKNLMGWKSATAAAREYRNTILATNAIENALNSGTLIGNKNLFKGTGGYMYKTPTGGVIMGKSKTSLVDRFGSAISSGMGVGATGLVAKTGWAALRGTAGSVMGKLVGILGGPWGLALSVGLPAVISMLTRAIQSNTKSTEQNTGALSTSDDMSGITYNRAYAHQVRFLSENGMDLTNQARLAALVSQKNLQNSINVNGDNKDGVRDIIIKINDETVFKKAFNNIVREQFQVAGTSLIGK